LIHIHNDVYISIVMRTKETLNSKHLNKEMSVLWLSFGIYIVGIALVLYVRPAMMFQPGGGTWKEFGLANTGNYTVFPFWMFTIIWAIVSYALATLGSMFFASVALKSSSANTTASNLDLFTPVSEAPEPPVVKAPKVKVPKPAAITPDRLPGYYVLESPAVGQPKYVYYGTEPPTL
jgi:hypothetical protein